MILNTADNSKIIQNAENIQLNNLTVLTGENGSGKTQLLEFIRDNALGFGQYDLYGMEILDQNGVLAPVRFPLLSDDNVVLKDIVYSYPGLRSDSAMHNDRHQPLIESIIERWNSLEPIVTAYRSVRHLQFSNIEEELTQLQIANERLVRNSIIPGHNSNAISIKRISIHDLESIKKLSQKCNRSIYDLSLIDFIIFYDVPLGLFSSALDLLFHQFELKKIYYPELTKDVTPPISIFNEILEKAQFRYVAEYQASTLAEIPLPVILRDRRNHKRVDFDNLSSGETTILALIFALYNSENKGHFPQVILFDEPDAHLHPSLTQIFFDVIEKVLVNEHGVNIILTTHSPSTVAIAPDDSIYCMDRDLGYPLKVDKKSAINMLSSGLASLTIEESDLGIHYNIAKQHNHILFTEGITDKINLEIAWDKLYPGKSRNFFIQDCFSAGFLSSLFNRGDDLPDGIFHQFEGLKMIALFDFDSEGYNNWNSKKKFRKIIEDDPMKCLTRTNEKENGFMMLLPVPEIPEIHQQVIIKGKDTFKDKSYLTIESLFYGVDALKSLFVKQKLPGHGTAHLINDNNKKKLSKKIEGLSSDDFKYFIPLFDKIEEILLNKS
ncbi:AAA family ATPase [Chryseobacterium shandongense]|uniref:AAA family ATPase n=1 Tax=Chryseobacterium shandongense TaxID=1493872 RepID=UPI000F4F00C2|nr:ATP-binding protein [Chryseobacterium shandongense]AZA58703.1 ATP-binding protein [Chryseobacterium shandongense]